MNHLTCLSHRAKPAPGETTVLEQVILTIFNIYFRGWDNFPAVLSNLEKFYAKTP